MKYIRVESNRAAVEIIPELDETFPNVPIEQRYSESFLKKCVKVEDEADVQTGYIYNKERDEFSPPVSIPAVPATADEAKMRKIEELSAECESAIVAGIDVAGNHYSLTLADQLNLESLKTTLMSGATAVPYHADGETCRMYYDTEFMEVYTACASHKIGHTTYFNQLKAYVNSLDDIEVINAVKYGDKLTGEYLEAYNAIMEAMSNG